MNTNKEFLKIQQKSVEFKLQNLMKLKRQLSLQQAINKWPPSKINDIQSDIDGQVYMSRLELRAIHLARAFLQNKTRSSVERRFRHTSGYENATLIAYMTNYITNSVLNCNINSFTSQRITNWLGLTEKDC